MSSKLIKKLIVTNGVILALSLSLLVYLFFFNPLRTTAVTSNALTELEAIKISSDTADIIAHAKRMYVITVQGTRHAWFLSGEIAVVLILITLLSILSLGWLGMLRKSSDATRAA
jgi:hypothetical protein